MSNIANIITIIIFEMLGFYLLYTWSKNKNRITIKDRFWNTTRILFIVAGVLSIFSIIGYSSFFDILRVTATTFCIVMFVLQRDGIGNYGIISLGSSASYDDIKAYDVHEGTKKTVGIFIVEDHKKKGEYTMQITFDAKDTEAVKKFLKDHIGNKYRRMKR